MIEFRKILNFIFYLTFQKMYTQETVLRYGKYRKFKLADVPLEYLYEIYKSKSWPDPALHEYLETHFVKLGFFKDIKVNGQKTTTTLFRKKIYSCDKETYANEKWARIALDSQNRHVNGPKRSKMRCYYCDRCGLWHLTSMSQEVWQAEPEKRRNHHRIKR